MSYLTYKYLTVSAGVVESADRIVRSSVSDHVGPMGGGGGALVAVYGVCQMQCKLALSRLH